MRVRFDTWKDEAGVIRRCPPAGKSLIFSYPSHAALRAFVFRRDGFQCRRCGFRPAVIPPEYDGRYTIIGPNTIDGKRQELQLDHRRPRCLGGSNHPRNLQVLCFTCNASKQHRVH